MGTTLDDNFSDFLLEDFLPDFFFLPLLMDFFRCAGFVGEKEGFGVSEFPLVFTAVPRSDVFLLFEDLSLLISVSTTVVCTPVSLSSADSPSLR